jgi:heme iron utilization protein
VAADRPIVKPEFAMSDKSFSPIAAARALLGACAVATLATRRADGHPFASLVTVAPDADGAPLLLLSRLAVHTRNLARDPRASLLLAEDAPGGPPLTRSRLTITGRVEHAADPAAARARFTARHPDSVQYADFKDFAFYRMEAADCYLVAGFGRIVEIAPAALHGKGAARG